MDHVKEGVLFGYGLLGEIVTNVADCSIGQDWLRALCDGFTFFEVASAQ